MTRAVPAMAILGLVLSACTAMKPESDDEELARFKTYFRQPVEQASYSGGISGWRQITNDHVAIFTGASDAYVIRLARPCSNLASSTGITSIVLSSPSGTIVRGDPVIVSGDLRCRILEIYPVDYKALEQAQREAR